MICKKVTKYFFTELKGAICFCEWDGKILMLKRSPESAQGNRWTAAPGGKLEKGETPLQAVYREVFEETGIELKQVEEKVDLFFQFPDIEYLLHIFYARLKEEPQIVLDLKEHTEWRWATLAEAYQMDLMRGGKECLDEVFKSPKIASFSEDEIGGR